MFYHTPPSLAASIQSNPFLDLELAAGESVNNNNSSFSMMNGGGVAAARGVAPVLPRCSSGLLPPPLATGRHRVGGPWAAPGTGPFMILQVVVVQDISLPYEQRLRALAGDVGVALGPQHRSSSSTGGGRDGSGGEGDNGDDEEEGGGGGGGVADAVLQASEAADEERRRRRRRAVNGRRRWLSFVLTDGFTRVFAVEARPPPSAAGRDAALFAEGVALGAKLKVLLSAGDGGGGEWLPTACHGVLRLHAGNTVLMGGAVPALEAYWQTIASTRLATLAGRPQRSPATTTTTTTTTEGRGGADEILSHAVAAPIAHPPQEQSNGQQPQQQQEGGGESVLCRPLYQWPAHASSAAAATTRLFLTRAVVTGVADLFINELDNATAATAAAGGGEGEGEEDSCRYSLMATLGPPDEDGSNNNSASAGFVLDVDLGHRWLRKTVGMPASQFRLLSESQAPHEQGRLERIVDRVAGVLEGLGETFFYLRRRPADGVVEVVRLEPVVGGGLVQQQQQQQQEQALGR